MVSISAYDLAQRFIGVGEVKGTLDNPQILAMLRLDGDWPEHDEVPWCSAFVNYIAWLLRLPRSKNLAARSWLEIGKPVELENAIVDSDVVILSRDGGGHVGFFAGLDRKGVETCVLMLGGNQGDKVCVASFPVARVLGVRRLS
jgi:uncharacterized protein (TIGR02594 family)